MSDDAYEGHMYVGEEAETIVKETRGLGNLWNAYASQMLNSNVAPALHPPPALWSLYAALLDERSLVSPLLAYVDCNDETGAAYSQTLENIISFGDAMFRFAQWCVARGMLHANMVQCKCGTITDSDLARLFPATGTDTDGTSG